MAHEWEPRLQRALDIAAPLLHPEVDAGLPSETGNAAPGFAPIARQSALLARAVATAEASDKNAVRRLSTVPERWRRPAPETGTETETEPPSRGPGTTAPLQEKPPLPEHAPPRAEAAEAERDTTPPAAPAPAPAPAPDKGVPGSHLWQLGVPQSRTSRPPGPTQPQQPPPSHQLPDPGLGMGD
ncbi:hypothetical protein PV733_08340 [Streptomyces europaeiscabiei]|uniref:hypothetical protein n=1 Tax=Streptomyces europaeiscabiei TaxID=146819 RepID=UPI0029B40B02|nr:hypothetical protein [Streptomyces europaeiscabiei]MDX3668164.1 hypothetical protein [Streptomyces europaeiscabiei]MDX3708981.1 hypothetical protein [Streptomyces europaeiscabiei]